MSPDSSMQAWQCCGAEQPPPRARGRLRTLGQPAALCCVLSPGASAGSGAVVWTGPHALTSTLSLQRAANIVRALELFVKPEQLGGDNAYRCSM